MKTGNTRLNRQYLVIQKENSTLSRIFKRKAKNVIRLLQSLFLVALITSITSCGPEEVVGPPGPQGPAGNDGIDGNPSQSNKTIFVPMVNFDYHSTTKVYRAQLTTSQMPVQAPGTLVIGFVLENPTGSTTFNQWIPMPYSEFYGTSGSFNELFYTIHENGRTWVYIRNSDGNVPYSNMNSSQYGMSYKFFTLKSANVPPGLDIHNYEAVRKHCESIDNSTK